MGSIPEERSVDCDLYPWDRHLSERSPVTFSKPKEVGGYSVPEGQVALNKDHLQYLRPDLNELLDRGNLGLDLNEGFAQRVPQKAQNEDELLIWMAKYKKENPRAKKRSVKEWLSNADFVARRGLLTQIAHAANVKFFFPHDPFKFLASIHENVIFLREIDSVDRKMQERSECEQLPTFYGFKFEQYMVVGDKSKVIWSN